MKKFSVLIILSLGVLICACKDASTDKKQNAAEEVAEVKQADQFKNGFPYKSIPQEMVMKVWNEVDMLDYIFHDLPFSMNQTEQASIRTNAGYIGREAKPYIPVDCKPIARQFYQTQGDIWLEADIYFTAECQFYVFFVDGKPSYANVMSEAGKQFFGTMINQALDASKAAGH